MSTLHGITELGPATARKYWNAFLEWRKLDRLRTQLCHLTDSELADIGITRGDIDYVASHRAIDPRSIPSTS